MDRFRRRGRLRPAAGYAAFISYSRAVDGRLAPALRSALQQFGKPWYRLRALRVFRDDASLSANPGLWLAITKALDSSTFFILLASPSSAQSPWVRRELSYWLANKTTEHLLVVLTDGEIVWDPSRGDFDWSGTSALPRDLGGQFADQPRYVDLRWAQSRENLSLRDHRFLEAVADLAAPLYGRPKDELIGDEVRQHRRARRVAWSAAAVLTALTATAIVLGIVANSQRQNAISQRDKARREASVAQSRFFASRAERFRGDDVPAALRLAARAYSTWPTAEAAASLASTLQASGRLVATVKQPGGLIASVAVSPDGNLIAAGSKTGVVGLWAWPRVRSEPPQKPLRLLQEQGAVEHLAFTSNGHYLVVATTDGVVSIWDVASGTRVARRIFRLSTVRDLALDASGTQAAVAYAPVPQPGQECLGPSRIFVLRVPTAQQLASIRADSCLDRIAFRGATVLESADQGAGGRLRWRLPSGRRLRSPTGVSETVGRLAVSYSPDGSLLAYITPRQIGGFDWDDPDDRQFHVPLLSVDTLVFAKSRYLAAAGEGKIVLWDESAARPQPIVLDEVPDARVRSLAVRPDGSFALALGQSLSFWTLRGASPLRTNIQPREGLRAGRFNDSETAASATRALMAWLAHGSIFVSRLTQPKPDVTRLEQPDGFEFSSLAFASSRAALYVLEGARISRIDLSKKQPAVTPLPVVEHELRGAEDAFLQDGRTAIARFAHRVAVIDLPSGDVGATVRGPVAAGPNEGAGPGFMAVSADRGWGASVSSTEVQIVDMKTGRSVAALPVEGAEGFAVHVAFSHDSKTLAVADSLSLRLWRFADRFTAAERAEHVDAVSYSPDGRYLATIAVASRKEKATVWALEILTADGLTRVGRFVFETLFDNQASFAWTGEKGQLLAVSSEGGAAAFWIATPHAWLRMARALAG